mmetsp:Transcript_29775/g.80533  ORF Transcript_29775/g.80533 Transcript_29775/m.80533 type:complete len:387 (-) Transcript_29775:115-1275(-)|eukprot:CAMPEP_0171189986 /NCGR_PEP_ID=MMETSP0790-20130122/18627_1 /TAXON_ID=2925 /ORGANISM="Alexandrium catenella, Strain OF101" /LENGTH=386 /DNA_ID=CAMNT_0011655111 /DNA_START=62 /DNA_END=1222 /DNA_ORIENTATION=-
MGGDGKGRGKPQSKSTGESKGTGNGKSKGRGRGKGSSKGAAQGKGTWVPVKPLVLVTGAGGYVAMNIVRVLTERGYRVRGTLRSLTDTAKVDPLKQLSPKIELHEADLLKGSEAFEAAMEGCRYVIHCAAPFKNRAADAKAELVDPCVKGTEAVLTAAIRTGVSRVVLTSSTAAVGPPLEWMRDSSLADKAKVFTEEDWNLAATLESAPYMFAKRVAEQRAWEIVKEAKDSMSLVAICPGFVIGPMLSARADGESVAFVRSMLDGTTKERGCKGAPLAITDVRDCAQAHVRALEAEAAGGKRFVLCSGRGHSKIELAKGIRELFKAYPVPEVGPEPEYSPEYDISQAREILQYNPKPVWASLRDMARAAIRLGIVERQRLARDSGS